MAKDTVNDRTGDDTAREQTAEDDPAQEIVPTDAEMSEHNRHADTDPPGGAADLQDRREAAGLGLAGPVREHLGRKLRATYNELAEKPQYLGDPAIPLELEHQIARIERREVIHSQGVKAVEAALEDLIGPDPKGDGRA